VTTFDEGQFQYQAQYRQDTPRERPKTSKSLPHPIALRGQASETRLFRACKQRHGTLDDYLCPATSGLSESASESRPLTCSVSEMGHYDLRVGASAQYEMSPMELGRHAPYPHGPGARSRLVDDAIRES